MGAYALIVLGVLITVFYSMRFLIVAISWVNRQRSLFLKIDIDFFTNFSMVVLILPAFLGGRMTNYLLKIDSLFLVSPLLKWGVLGGLRAGVILFYVIFLNKNFTHLSPKNRVIAN